MKIVNYITRTGIKMEAIKLWEDDEYSDYVVTRNSVTPKFCNIIVDNSGGRTKEVDFEYLKTLTDSEILDIFYPKRN